MLLANMAAVDFRVSFLFLILFDFKHIAVHFKTSSSAAILSDNIFGRIHCAEPLNLAPAAVNRSLFTVSPRLLWIRPARSVSFRPKPSRNAVFVVLLLLASGDIKLSPGLRSSSSHSIYYGSLNCRSAANKAAAFHTIIQDHKLDVLALQET